MDTIRPGDPVRVTALRADGTAYRWWEALVEEVSTSHVVTYAPPGHAVHQPDGKGWTSRCHIRAHYWSDRWNNLLEVYEPDGRPLELYVHIAAPPRVTARRIAYVDHELDVVMPHGRPAQVVDEDDFADAIQRYGYTEALQARCRDAVEEAMRLVAGWTWSPCLPRQEPPRRARVARLQT